MARKRYKPEEIVAKLRQVDVLVSQEPEHCGRNPSDRRKRGDVLSVASGVGGLKIEQVKRLKDFELENSQSSFRSDAWMSPFCQKRFVLPARSKVQEMIMSGAPVDSYSRTIFPSSRDRFHFGARE